MTATTFNLDAALREYVSGLGLTLGGWDRLAWNGVSVVFGKGSNFVGVSAAAIKDRSLYPDADALDRAIFEIATIAIDGMAYVEGWVE